MFIGGYTRDHEQHYKKNSDPAAGTGKCRL